MPFDLKALLDTAIRDAGGLSDFGDPHFIEPLTVLCHALNTEANLSEFGEQLFRHKLGELLVNRLRMEDYLRQFPQILDEVIAPPLVIVGLPRSGTTLLQRLLAQDPQFYSMAWWESRYPVPFVGESLTDPSPRILQARGEVAQMITAMPKLLSIHPMDADQADEEVMLMEHSFISAMDSYANVPSYVAWVDSHDETPAYDYLRRTLQFLQWQKRQRGISAQRWVLKTPHHLLRMHLLLKAFPDCLVVQTHRDPVHTIPSIASFIHTLWCIYGQNPSAQAAGNSWSTRMARALVHTLAVRSQQPNTFMDVPFADTVKQPLDVVQRIYDFAQLRLDPASLETMRVWLQANARENRAAHEYDSSDFGLDMEQLKRDFAEYRQRYFME